MLRYGNQACEQWMSWPVNYQRGQPAGRLTRLPIRKKLFRQADFHPTGVPPLMISSRSTIGSVLTYAYAMDYWCDEIKWSYLERHAPFVARELDRKGRR